MIWRIFMSLFVGFLLVLIDWRMNFDRYSATGRIEGSELTRSKYSVGVPHHIKSILSHEYNDTAIRLDWLSIECHHILVMRLNKLKRGGFPDSIDLIFPENSLKIFSFDYFRRLALHYQANKEDFQSLADQEKFEFNRLQMRLSHIHQLSYYNPAWETSFQWFYITESQLRKIIGESFVPTVGFNLRGQKFKFALDPQIASDLRAFIANVKCK